MRSAPVYLVFIAILVGLVALNYALSQRTFAQKQRIEGLQLQVNAHERQNRQLQDRNDALIVDVDNLRSQGAYYVYEEKARENYGLIGQNETFFFLPAKEVATLPDIPGLPDHPEGSPFSPFGQMLPDAPPSTIPVAPIPLQLESLKP